MFVMDQLLALTQMSLICVDFTNNLPFAAFQAIHNTIQLVDEV